MNTDLLQTPNPNDPSRREAARAARQSATELAFQRRHQYHEANADEIVYWDGLKTTGKKKIEIHVPMNFTKGLPHHPKTGTIVNINDYLQFTKAISTGERRDFRETPLGHPRNAGKSPEMTTCKKAESACPLSHDLEDTRFAGLERLVKRLKDHSTSTLAPKVKELAEKVKKGKVGLRAWESQSAGLAFDLEGPDAQALTMPPAPALSDDESRAELMGEMAEVYAQALLRDVPFDRYTPGYQFKKSDKTDAKVLKVIEILEWLRNEKHAFPGRNIALPKESDHQHCSTAPHYPDIFAGHNVFRGVTQGDLTGPYLSQFMVIGNRGVNPGPGAPDPADGRISFGAQDTYVHYDALYQAYLNACLIMLGDGVKFDPGIPFTGDNDIDHQQGFAHFGGPHILSLVTEVATRALKAVRFQKYNVHRRLRPEALAARLEKHSLLNIKNLNEVNDALEDCGLLGLVRDHNRENNGSTKERNVLLPMAFTEGSPMHPTYGAGHATVAGACVTVLKAFFDGSVVLDKAYQTAPVSGSSCGESEVVPVPAFDGKLTVEGELNKLAANISIGRNWAGVHYYSDYIESLRLGEEIAISILEEQKLMFGERFHMSFTSFDGVTMSI